MRLSNYMALRRSIICCCLAVFFLTNPARRAVGEDEDSAPRPEPQKLDAFLLDWVRGEAKYEWFTHFHEIAQSSPHKVDTEEWEVSAKAYFFKRDASAREVLALAIAALALHADEETSADARLRVLYLLGRLAAPNSLDLLCRSATSDAEPTATTAIYALGCFGSAPWEELFSIYGGSLRSVVYPAAPSERATRVLCEVLRRDPPSRVEGEGGQAFRERLDRWLGHRYAVADALESHRGKIVVGTVISELPRKRYPWSGFPCAQEDLVDVLVANAAHVEPGDLARLTALRDDEEIELRVRNLASDALRRLASPGPKRPLKPGVYRY